MPRANQKQTPRPNSAEIKPGFSRGVAFIIAVALLATSGVVHGVLTDRWSTGTELQRAAESLNAMPAAIGDWQSRPVEISERQLKQAEAVGHLSREYVHRVTGESVTVLIVCGRPGPIAVHPPTVCFTSAGWALTAEPRRFTLPEANPAAEFWVGDFVKPSATGQAAMRTFWTWSTGTSWKIPENPRFSFARYPFLYKMYILRSLGRGDSPVESDSALVFTRLFLSELNRVLEKND